LQQQHAALLDKFGLETSFVSEQASQPDESDEVKALLKNQIAIYEMKLEEKMTTMENMEKRHEEEIVMINDECDELARQIHQMKLQKAEDQQKLFELKRQVQHRQFEIQLPPRQESSEIAEKLLELIRDRIK
jgi:hypothetical protein